MADAEPDASRRCGVEIEFSGLTPRRAAEVVGEAIGGEVDDVRRHVSILRDTPIGDMTFELDTRYAKPAEVPGLIDRALDAFDARDDAAEMLASIMPVPVELVTGPIRRDGFDMLGRAVAALRAAGTDDTKGGTLYAYGMHLNPEHTGSVDEALRIAAAFAFAEPQIRRARPPDNARRVTPFVDPYPNDFVLELTRRFAGGRVPPLEEFLPLYARYNPDRNRGLDLWPLFGHLDRALAERHHAGPVKGARPTFHYRLPDSLVAIDGWSPVIELDRWERIEAVARDPDTFEALRAAASDFARNIGLARDYYETVGELLG